LREAQATSGIRNQRTGIRSVSGSVAAGVTKPHQEYHPTVGARRAVPDQESKNKNRETREKRENLCKHFTFAPFAVKIGFHLIPVVLSIIHTQTESLWLSFLSPTIMARVGVTPYNETLPVIHRSSS
jgi:hypothetical protein